MSIKFDRQHLKDFIQDKELDALSPMIQRAHDDLTNKKGKGSEFAGWVDLPSRIEDSFLKDLNKLGQEVRKHSDCLVSIGIGGSYLGIRAAIEFLGGKIKLPIHFAGHNMSADYFYQLLNQLKNQNLTVIVISKSGTTTEPALAFRVIYKAMQKKYTNKELKKRIICITDQKKGALRAFADQNGYQAFAIPPDVGGRFSVLTPVGLVPLAIVGIDIKSLVEGAQFGQSEYANCDLEKNSAYLYAGLRYLLYQKGKVIEMLSSFYDHLFYLAEWWKQLFAESEGKEGKGIFPTSLILSTDLHSLGQLLQEGHRNMFETFLMIDEPRYKLTIPQDKDNWDDFNCVAGKDLDFVNKQAYKATAAAHYEGGVPNMTLSVCKADCFHLGQLFYFFSKAVAISGYLLGVNPFDQPGVEAYKRKMFSLLGKRG